MATAPPESEVWAPGKRRRINGFGLATRLHTTDRNMRLIRILPMLVLTLLLAVAAGCGGTNGGMMSDDGGGGDGGSNLALFSACTADGECASGTCTQISYDRSPTPICTYKCDANDMNPLCPMGCNPKGYCKKPM
jgi:hypothetical protein